MKPSRCPCCSESFSYSQLIKLQFSRRCPACRRKLFLTRESQFKSSIPPVLMLCIPAFLMLIISPVSITFYLLTGAAMTVLIVAVQPWTLEFTDKEEALF
ncbi:TIGR04104 family putative zinc finger protein [Bacillus daqingensis]|uniref:TIGR04104 family putative zinc finger protein n=1 Tax=Bacillus daqingensis TaxID=872396 RepID=A0ABV9NTE7_9BACI